MPRIIEAKAFVIDLPEQRIAHAQFMPPARIASVQLRDGGRPGYVWVYSLWVDPKHRGKGHGRALMDKLKAYAKEQGVCLRLQPGADDSAPGLTTQQLYDWYLRQGFEDISQNWSPRSEHPVLQYGP